VLPYSVPLAVDFAVSVVFLIVPVVFGLSGIDAWCYWAKAAALFVVVVCTSWRQHRRSCSSPRQPKKNCPHPIPTLTLIKIGWEFATMDSWWNGG